MALGAALLPATGSAACSDGCEELTLTLDRVVLAADGSGDDVVLLVTATDENGDPVSSVRVGFSVVIPEQRNPLLAADGATNEAGEFRAHARSELFDGLLERGTEVRAFHGESFLNSSRYCDASASVPIERA